MRILVAEDEVNIANYLKKTLQAEGFVVDVAHNGSDALDLVHEKTYDAITLDIMMPDINGYDVCRSIRDAGITTPILMLTAKDGEYDEADALDLGADDFLRKPFSLVVLLARLRSLTRRSSTARTSSLEVGDLALDAQRKTVVRAGVEIELTPREFSLLEYLMVNAGQPLSKAQLLDHVWGAAIAADENVVEVYIGYLRKKVDAPFETKLIHTVRGVGYRIDEG